MSSDPVCCTPETRLQEVAKMMVECDCGQIPVVEAASSPVPIGVVTDRDIVCRCVSKGLNPSQMTAAEVMSSPVVTVRPGSSLEECCQRLTENQLRRVPVVDDDGRCCGIVAQADIAQNAPAPVTSEVVRTVSRRTVSSRAYPSA